MPELSPVSAALRVESPAPSRNAALHKVLTELEAVFLAEMLEGAGLGAASESFGGGVGEEQFGSFLRQEQAGQMARAGGIGLAEAMFTAMARGARDE
ncbi:MAG: rod-binding protein [Rhodobacteraceae bacterium]|nr:rod-binding protein [Paracoccaceae bacterium]